MNLEFPNSALLLQKAQEEKIYDQLVAQLKKDFTLANVLINLPLDVSPGELQATLHEKIYYLILEKFTEYLNLLYIVDVSERAFKGIKGADVVEVAEQVSLLILLRELQKVRLKAKYA